MHHTYSDTAKDPHNPKFVGIWKVLTSTFEVPVVPRKFVSDLIRNRRVLWFHKHHNKIRFFTFVISFFLFPTPYFLALIVAPFFYGHLGFGLLNTLCHLRGQVENSWLANILTGGDGWHANHHKNPNSWKVGHKFWEFDPGALFIWLVKKRSDV